MGIDMFCVVFYFNLGRKQKPFDSLEDAVVVIDTGCRVVVISSRKAHIQGQHRCAGTQATKTTEK